MCKSFRNQLVESFKDELIKTVAFGEDKVKTYPTEQEDLLAIKSRVQNAIGAGGPFAIKYTLTMESGEKGALFLQGGAPIISVVLAGVVKDKPFLLHADSRLKVRDEWDAYIGYEICCTRIARQWVDLWLEDVDETIDAAYDVYSNLVEMYYGEK